MSVTFQVVQKRALTTIIDDYNDDDGWSKAFQIVMLITVGTSFGAFFVCLHTKRSFTYDNHLLSKILHIESTTSF